MVGAITLECSKNTLNNEAVLNNRINGPVEKFDSASILASVFGFQIREFVRNEATNCNELTTDLAGAEKKGSNHIMATFGVVNQKVASLESILSWAQGASEDLLKSKDISDIAKHTIATEMRATIKQGHEVISHSIDKASETINSLSGQMRGTSVEKAADELKEVEMKAEKFETNNKNLELNKQTDKFLNKRIFQNENSEPKAVSSLIELTGLAENSPVVSESPALEAAPAATAVTTSVSKIEPKLGSLTTSLRTK